MNTHRIAVGVVMQSVSRTLLLLAFLTTLVLSIAPTVQARTCSNATGAGDWGCTVTGLLILPTGQVPIGQVGNFTLDAEGNVVGRQTRSLGGAIGHETILGKAQTNPDCTGTATLQIFDESGALARTATLDFIFVDSGSEARYIVTSTAYYPMGQAYRRSRPLRPGEWPMERAIRNSTSF